VPDVARLVTGLQHALSAHPDASSEQRPLIIVDGYHGFGAIPTDLSAVAAECCYVGCDPLSPGDFRAAECSKDSALGDSVLRCKAKTCPNPCTSALTAGVLRAEINTILHQDACAACLAHKSGTAEHLQHGCAHQGPAKARGLRRQRGVHEPAGGAAPAPGRHRLAGGRERPGSRLRRPPVA